MKYRQLGNSGIKVSEIGFGGWGLSGDSYGSITEQASENALRIAHEQGVTFFDTSDFYGNGRSERIIGKTFEKIYLFVVFTIRKHKIRVISARRMHGKEVEKYEKTKKDTRV